MATIALVPFGDRDAIRGRFENLVALRPGSLDGVKIAMLRDTISDFIAMRFVNTSVDEYKRWRRSRGEVLADEELMLKTWHVADSWKSDFGEDPRGKYGLEEMFDRLWVHATTAGSGENTPVSMADDPRGFGLGVLEGAGSRRWPTPEGRLGDALWAPAPPGTVRNWWMIPGIHPADLDYTFDYRVAAGVVLGYADGSRLTMNFLCGWNPRTSDWCLAHVQLSGEADDRPRTGLDW